MNVNFDFLKYDRKLIYNPRIPFEKNGYLPTDPYVFDIITGRDFISMNNFSYICHNNVNQIEACQILKNIDLPIPKQIIRYSNKNSYEGLLTSLTQKKDKIILQYPHMKDYINPEVSHVDSSIILYISDKANISKLVDLKHIPKRISNISSQKIKFPCVVKTLDGKPTAGGYGVKVCQNLKEYKKALYYFRDSKYFIEEYISSAENICLQFFCDEKGNITYLGVTDQIIDSFGSHKGNIIRQQKKVNEKIVEQGYMIMDKVYKLGYYGCAGFDVLIDSYEKFYFIDLNFRLNASTTALLLKDYVRETFDGKDYLLGTFSFSDISYEVMLKHIRTKIEEKSFIPLSMWNPENYYKKTPTSCIGMILFDSYNDIKKAKRDFLTYT